MSDKPDAQLLREYLQAGDEAAFREIVIRHADAVYSSALRQVGSSDAAADVAQTVFTDLARKASSLSRTIQNHGSLLGWLYRSTRFAALNQLRNDRRRQAREKQAMEYLDHTPETDPEWERVRPVLDEAMSELKEEDREALLLRYFNSHGFRTIGDALGVSDDAAQKRVSRAVEKLRVLLAERGVTTTAAFAAALSANTMTAAPAGLASTLSTAALISAPLTVSSALAATKTIAMTTLQKTIFGAALAAAVGTTIYEVRQSGWLRDQLQTLRQEQAVKISQLEGERDRAANQLAGLIEETNRLAQNAAELLRLRAQVARLQSHPRQTSEHASPVQLPTGNATAENAPSDIRELPKDSWADAGFGNPQTALRTRGWAVVNGNRERFKTSVHITDGARKRLEDAFIQMAEASKDPNKGQYIEEVLKNKFGVEEGILMPMMAEDKTRGYAGYRILSQKPVSPDQTLLEVETKFAAGPARTEMLKFRRFGDDWKVVIDEEFVRQMLPPGL